MEVVAIVGNGASLPFTRDLALKPLVDRLTADLDAADPSLVEALRKLAERLAIDGATADARSNFEALLGPLDRLGHALLALQHGTGLAAPANVAQALTLVTNHFGSLYRLGLGTVLHHIADLSTATHGKEFSDHGEFATWLVNLTEQGVLRVFTLNYDVLLDAQLLELHSAGRIALSDQGDARPDARARLRVVQGGNAVDAMHLRAPDEEYLSGYPAAVVYHLHGSLQWVRHRRTGDCYKVTRLSDLRDGHFFEAVADGRTKYDPVVVLTDRKSQETLREPFAGAYAQLETAISTCDRLVIAGYGFGDVPMAQALRRALRQRATSLPKIAVIGYANVKQAAFKQQVLDDLALDPATRTAVEQVLTVSRRGLPEAVRTTLAAWPT